jgi:hypothetical protein
MAAWTTFLVCSGPPFKPVLQDIDQIVQLFYHEIGVLMFGEMLVYIVDQQHRSSASTETSSHVVDGITDHDQAVPSVFVHPLLGNVQDTGGIRLRRPKLSRHNRAEL